MKATASASSTGGNAIATVEIGLLKVEAETYPPVEGGRIYPLVRIWAYGQDGMNYIVGDIQDNPHGPHFIPQDEYRRGAVARKILEGQGESGRLGFVRRAITSPDTTIKEGDGVSVLPITHNANMVILSFFGWEIRLYEDGSWKAEDTTGG